LYLGVVVFPSATNGVCGQLFRHLDKSLPTLGIRTFQQRILPVSPVQCSCEIKYEKPLGHASPPSTTINAGHDHEPGTYTFHPVPHNVGPVGSVNGRSMGIPRVERSISHNVRVRYSSLWCVALNLSPRLRRKCRMGDARRVSVAIRESWQGGRRCYDSVRLS